MNNFLEVEFEDFNCYAAEYVNYPLVIGKILRDLKCILRELWIFEGYFKTTIFIN